MPKMQSKAIQWARLANAFKVETGGEVQVPLYIQQDDTIKIDLRDLSFVERVNR